MHEADRPVVLVVHDEWQALEGIPEQERGLPRAWA